MTIPLIGLLMLISTVSVFMLTRTRRAVDKTRRELLKIQHKAAGLEYQLARDNVTSAQSRIYFKTRLADGARQEKVILILLDVDQFKSVNDTYGHEVGDELLCGLATEGWSMCRNNDFVARIGGDEFCVVLYDLDMAQATQIANQLRLNIERSALVKSRPGLHRTISLGLAELWPNCTLDTVLGEADVALYAAKEMGRNRAIIVDDDLRREQKRQRAEPTLEDVRAGLQKNEFTYFVQPVFDLTTLRPVGVEALIRWVQADGTIRLPSEFIHLFTRRFTGSIKPPLQLANTVANALTNSNADMFCAFNISTSFLQSNSSTSPEWLEQLLMGLNPHQTVFEIVESAALDHADSTRDMLNFLRSQGVRIALDDFGTGYSNFARLCDLPVDIVKIDKSMIRKLPENPKQKAILSALMTMAAEIGFEVIAEGVETLDELEAIKALGINRAQGFLLGRPQKLEDWNSGEAILLPGLQKSRSPQSA